MEAVPVEIPLCAEAEIVGNETRATDPPVDPPPGFDTLTVAKNARALEPPDPFPVCVETVTVGTWPTPVAFATRAADEAAIGADASG